MNIFRRFTHQHSVFSKFSIIPIFCCAALMLNGCSKSDSVSLEALQTENSNLKAQLDKLKSDLATAQEQCKISGTSLKTASTDNLFTDLDPELQTTVYIQDLGKLGVFKDMGKEFKPYETITRAEYITWLFKAYNAIAKGTDKIQLAPNFDPGFKDISPSHPAYKYVASLANAGYSVGYDDKTFKPDQPITREEMIGIKLGIDTGKTHKPEMQLMTHAWKFSDANQVDPKFSGYILADSSLIPFENIKRAFGTVGTFKPKQAVLRHEAAATLWGFKSPGIHGTSAPAALKRQQEEQSAQ